MAFVNPQNDPSTGFTPPVRRTNIHSLHENLIQKIMSFTDMETRAIASGTNKDWLKQTRDIKNKEVKFCMKYLNKIIDSLDPEVNADQIIAIRELADDTKLFSPELDLKTRIKYIKIKIFKILKLNENIKNFSNNKEILLIAIAVGGAVLAKEMSGEIRQDSEFFKEAVVYEPRILQYASKVIKENKEIGMKAVEKDGIAVFYLSADLQRDDDIVDMALSQNGLALMYLQDLQDNESVVRKAMAKNPKALRWASARLKKKFRTE